MGFRLTAGGHQTLTRTVDPSMFVGMDMQRRLRAAAEAFVTDLDGLVRQATLEAVEAMFDGRALTGGAKAARARGAAPGAKRSPAELEALCEALYAAVAANAGMRIEELAATLAVPSRTLALPTRKLLEARRIRKKGEKRSTRYFPR